MTSTKPIIGITMDYDMRNLPTRKKLMSFLYPQYYDAIVRAGGLPITLPPLEDKTDLAQFLPLVSGILFPGGEDLSPEKFGQEPHPAMTRVQPRREEMELALIELADKAQIPVLGICMGCQVLNVYRGGDIIQDIPDLRPDAHPHKAESGNPCLHPVQVAENSRLHRILGKTTFTTNSYHHQSIGAVGDNLIVNGQTEDGIIEGIEATDHPFMMGFQWHVELDRDHTPENDLIFEAFVEAARTYRDERSPAEKI